MRFLGEINGRKSAEQFVAFLLTENIDTHLELARQGSDDWEIWVREEDRMDQAERELRTFLVNRSDPKYANAVGMS